jgi:ArsR family transcriptional regulator
MSPIDPCRVAKALADPQRCEILERVASAGELCCSDLMRGLEVSQATISHHLKELSTAGLLERRKDGQFAYFRFVPETMQGYLDSLQRRLGLCEDAPNPKEDAPNPK